MTIILADDHEVVRRGLRGMLEGCPGWSVVGEAADGHAALNLVAELHPDVALIDIAMPGLNGLEVTRQIRKTSPSTEVLVFTMIESEDLVRQVLSAGARGYLLKSDLEKSIIAAIEALSQHKPFFNLEVSEKVLAGYLRGKAEPDSADGPARGETLTRREREVAQAIAEGLSNKDIARKLDISVKTVEAHRASLMKKIGAHSAVDVARYAARNNIKF